MTARPTCRVCESRAHEVDELGLCEICASHPPLCRALKFQMEQMRRQQPPPAGAPGDV